MPSFGSYFRRRDTEWIRTSLRTPGILIFGMVMAPCGWVLTLVTTVAPNWRTLQGFTNLPPDRVIEQGIFDICIAATSAARQQCNQQDTTYFANNIINIAKGLMLGSLIVCLVGIAVAIPGVRCWRDRPQWVVCTVAGFLIFIAGVLALIPVSWYTHIINDITSGTQRIDVRAGYCLILGFIGGIFEVLGGFVMTLGCCRCCGGKNRGERPIEEVLGPRARGQPKSEPRRVEVPRLTRARSVAPSSIPESYKESIDDDVSFPVPRAPRSAQGSATPPSTGGPTMLIYEAHHLGRRRESETQDAGEKEKVGHMKR